MEIDKIKLQAHLSEVRKHLDEIDKILNDKRSVDERKKSFYCEYKATSIQCVTQCAECKFKSWIE